VLSENLPFPSFAKRGERLLQKKSPFEKGGQGGFDLCVSGYHG
jgi:hypothetical protein